MKIGFDAKRYFNNSTGLGNYARQIIDQWACFFPEDKLFLFCPGKRTQAEIQILEKKNIEVIQSNWGSASSIWRSLLPEKICGELKISVYHGLSNEVPLFRHSDVSSFVSIHDCLFRSFPAQYSFIDRIIYDLKTKMACNSNTHIIAVSEATKQDLVKFYNVAPEKIFVVPQTIHPIFAEPLDEAQLTKARTKFKVPKNYAVAVGSVVFRKNQLRLIQAFKQSGLYQTLTLAIIGSTSTDYGKAVKDEVKKLNLEPHVLFLEHLNIDEMSNLLKGAKFSTYVSLGEGFGLPVAESITAGIPVLTSNVSSMPEAARGFGQLVDPTSLDALIEGLRYLNLEADALKMALSNEKERGNMYSAQKQVEHLRSLYSKFSKAGRFLS